MTPTAAATHDQNGVAATAGPTDRALLNESLDLAALRCDDLTPLVYQRFFDLRPDAMALFTIPDPGLPPLGCGQMLYEIICLLLDNAAGEAYVSTYMRDIAAEHRDHKVFDRALYQDFLAALVDVLDLLLGPEWTQAFTEAWERQCKALLGSLPSFPQQSRHPAGCPVAHAG